MRFILTDILIFMFFWGSPVCATETPLHISPGDKIRITGYGVDGVYILDKIHGNILVIRSEQGLLTERINTTAIASLEVSVPRSRGEGASRGAGLGFFIGVGVGIVLGLVSGSDPPCSGEEMCLSFDVAEKAVVLGGLFGVCGAVIGSITGVLSPGKNWEKINLEVFNGSSLHGYGLRISLGK